MIGVELPELHLSIIYSSVKILVLYHAVYGPQEVCVSEAKAKALDDAAVMRQELQDQYQQQELVGDDLRVGAMLL